MTKTEIAPTTCGGAISAYWPADSRATALAVARVESGLRADAHNYSDLTKDNSFGCFQINRYGNLATSRPAAEWLIDPANNAQYALGMFRAQGFCAPWYNTSKKLGLCK